MIDSSSLQGMSSCLNVMNAVLSAVAAIMLVILCFSYSDSESTAHSIPFMVVTDSIVGISICMDIGLKTACPSYCGSKECLSPSGVVDLFNYSTLLERCPIPVPDGATEFEIQEAKDSCTTIQQCDTGGKVTFAFALISYLLAMATSAACYYRIKDTQSDDPQIGYASKRFAICLSVSCLLSAAAAYGAMQWCAFGMDHLLSNAYSSASTGGLPSMDISVSPGSGGVLVILSMVCFSVMIVTNVVLPSSSSSGGVLADQDTLKEPLNA